MENLIQSFPTPSYGTCWRYRHWYLFSIKSHVNSRQLLWQIYCIDGGVNLKVRGLTGTWGECRHRNAKIWGKKGRFCTNLAKTGEAPTALPPMYWSFRHILFSLVPPLAFKIFISDPTMDKCFCGDPPAHPCLYKYKVPQLNYIVMLSSRKYIRLYLIWFNLIWF